MAEPQRGPVFASSGESIVPRMDVHALIEAEKQRRGEPDPVSGAFGRLALTQGTLLKEEYDRTTHFFAGGAIIGAAIVDTLGLIHLNMKYGFKAIDAVLAAQVKAIATVCPRAKIVRIHGDAFAAILGPTADQRVDESLRPKLTAALEKVMPEPSRFSVALLEMRVANPTNHEVL